MVGREEWVKGKREEREGGRRNGEVVGRREGGVGKGRRGVRGGVRQRGGPKIVWWHLSHELLAQLYLVGQVDRWVRSQRKTEIQSRDTEKGPEWM